MHMKGINIFRFVAAKRSLLFTVVVSCISALSVHAQTRISVTDQNGSPLADTVIEIIDAGAMQGLAPGVELPGTDSQRPGVIMDQVNKRFVPDLLVVAAGTDIDFPNSDDIRHHVYSFSPANPFELKLYSGIPEDPVNFPETGVVILGCNIHDSMVGYVYVAASEYVYRTDASGEVSIGAVPEGTRIAVWHSLQRAQPEMQMLMDLADLPRDGNGRYLVSMETQAPTPRNTFQDQFGAPSE